MEWLDLCNTMRFWGKDEERGVLWACIAAITIFLLVIPDPDTDLTVVFPGNPPYSWLWYLLNPLYWTKRAYSMIIFAEWAGVTAVEWWLVHKGKLNGGLVKLQIVSTTLLVMLHAYQDVTVIMFGPFLFGFVLEILQKIPLPGTPQWICAFHGTGTQITYWTNPCLSSSTQWNLLGGHVYALTYLILIMWIVLPLILHLRARKLLGVGGGRIGSNRVERERVVVSDPQTISKQSALSPTKTLSRFDILLLLAIGVTAHDFASYYGFHVSGVHAFTFSLPMIGVILFIKFEKRIRRRWKR